MCALSPQLSPAKFSKCGSSLMHTSQAKYLILIYFGTEIGQKSEN